MVFQAPVGGILVAVGDKVPALTTYQLREEATRIARTPRMGVLCHGQEGKSLAVTVTNEALRVGLLKEDQKPRCILEIVEDNVAEGWGRYGGCPDSGFPLAPTTSWYRAGGGRAWTGGSGLLVLELLEGLLVYTREW